MRANHDDFPGSGLSVSYRIHSNVTPFSRRRVVYGVFTLRSKRPRQSIYARFRGRNGPVPLPTMAMRLLRMNRMRSNRTTQQNGLTNSYGNRQSTRVLLSELVADYGVLESMRCRCTKMKSIGNPFCAKCWNALPASHQRAVRLARPARTFATAYWAASASLDNKSLQDGRPPRLYQSGR